MTLAIKPDLDMVQADLHFKFLVRTQKGSVVGARTHTLRLTVAYCAPSLSELIMNMQNHLDLNVLIYIGLHRRYTSYQWCSPRLVKG